jgi:hypothetical protein
LKLNRGLDGCRHFTARDQLESESGKKPLGSGRQQKNRIDPVLTGDMQDGFCQLMADATTLNRGIHRNRSQKCAIGVEFRSGHADDPFVVPGHDHRLDMLVDSVERQMVPFE